ncbi:MAG: hypothetical protein GVY19_10810 [Bacteroidetes bacterium]|nr:hypothetical protein [Bacteroidota bacterium]
MKNSQHDIKNLITHIYECQKKIILNKHFIKELELLGEDTTNLDNEIRELEQKISVYKSELRKNYEYAY